MSVTHDLLIILAWTVAVSVVAFAALAAWGIARVKRNRQQAADAARAVALDRIPSLADECIRAFREKLGVELDLSAIDETAWKLDRAVNSSNIVDAFENPAFPWYFTLPAGAYMGEFIRANTKSEWTISEEGPTLRTVLKEPAGAGGESVTSECWPLMKIIKQRETGQHGDLYAFIVAAIKPSEGLLAQVEKQLETESTTGEQG